MKLVTQKPRKVADIDHVATGALCRKERLALGIVQTAMSAHMGFDKSYLCDLEAGRKQWRQELVNKANEAFEHFKANPHVSKVGRPNKTTTD